MKGWLSGIAIAVLVGVATYSVIYLRTSGHYIPSEFSQARIDGAELAKHIVELSNESLGNLATIADYDRLGKKSEALILISQEVVKTRDLQEEAIKLSSQLESMARTVEDIRPGKARVLAAEAISSEVALVSRLLSYNDLLLQLFEALRNKFQHPDEFTNGKVEGLVTRINEEATAINTFNDRFGQSLAEFDKLF